VLGDACVYAEWEHEIHGCVGNGAEDTCWHTNIPANRVLVTERPQAIFLGVVEIGFERYARCGFDLRKSRGAEVDAVVFGAGLQHYTAGCDGGEGKGREEVIEEEDLWMF
jgi:hypothetical protein